MSAAVDPDDSGHAGEPGAHGIASNGLNDRMNWLRAGVLGANDGIVSVAGVVMGVAGATTDRGPILVAGVAALVAGALSMAAGEYVSVSTQRDSEDALLAKEREELATMPAEEFAELEQILRDRGLRPETASEVATQLTERNALRAHAVLELGLDPDDLTNPWAAALASMFAFTVGALLPLLTILLPSPERVAVTTVAVLLALALTGWTSSRLGYGRAGPAVLRNLVGGGFAMGITFLVGTLLGTHV